MFWRDKRIHRAALQQAAEKLYDGLIHQARLPVFYTELRVADTADGRFDMLALHAFLVLERLGEAGQAALAQALIDRIFADFEAVMRESGTGDGGIFKNIKGLASAFYGRLQGYATLRDGAGWRDALRRNLYRGAADAPVERLARYCLALRKQLALWLPPADALDFGPLTP
ncbi:MAG: ubiquinol-cytochrome C chaperone family protein [Rhizomicrobium sp.]